MSVSPGAAVLEPTPDSASVISGGAPQQRFWQRHATILLAVFLALLTLALYANSIHAGFVSYDDPGYVTNNSQVQRGLTGPGITWAFTTTTEANWHPLTWLSHMTDVQVFGMRPAGHHLTNVLLHTLNVVLFFLLLHSATRAHLRSAAAAALFAVHPLNVESVAWIAERKSLVCAVFMFLTLAAYGWYVRKPALGRYLVVALWFVLGLMAKPMIITLPFAFLLLDYWPLGRFSSRGSNGDSPRFLATLLKLSAEKIPLLLLSFASAIITVYAQRTGGALGSLVVLPLGQRLNNAIYSYLAYIVKTVWPARLAVFYPHPEGALALWRVFAAAGIILLISILVWRERNRGYPPVGWLWYLGTLFPVIGIVQVGRQAMADRYAYISILGLFVIAVWSIAEFAPRLRLAKSSQVVLAAAALFLYVAFTYVQIGYWRNTVTLFSHALKITADNGIAEDNLGTGYIEMGMLDKALPHYLAAVRLSPQLFTPHYNLASLLLRENHPDQAQREFEIAIQTASDPSELAQAHNNLGVLLIQKNELPAALREFNAALQSNSKELNSLIGRGAIEFQMGKLDPALADFQRATQVAPSAIAYFWLGRAFEGKGDIRSAMQAYENAARLAPAFASAHDRAVFLRGKLQN
jgi:tetratricopeptide (TPR) repeat protein